MEGQGDETDFYGAGEFLPADNEGVSIGDVKEVKVEIHKPSKPKRNKPVSSKTENTNNGDEGFQFDKGIPTDDGDDVEKPGNDGSGGGNNLFDDPTENGGHGSQAGDNSVLKKVPLSGIKYKNIIANKKQGIYDIVFVSPYTENNCDLEVMMCGEASDKYHVSIQNVTINGKVGVVKNGKLIDFQIRKGVKYKIQYRTGELGVFSSEVIMNAYR